MAKRQLTYSPYHQSIHLHKILEERVLRSHTASTPVGDIGLSGIIQY
uniref:Uncharacterized protein n=1 Tax=Rhizophora mucronata TaxID=61149 RepID=A0A2P2Q293_RHIMU